METVKPSTDLSYINAFMAGHDVPQEPQVLSESNQPSADQRSGKIDIPEEMLIFAAFLNGLS